MKWSADLKACKLDVGQTVTVISLKLEDLLPKCLLMQLWGWGRVGEGGVLHKGQVPCEFDETKGRQRQEVGN